MRNDVFDLPLRRDSLLLPILRRERAEQFQQHPIHLGKKMGGENGLERIDSVRYWARGHVRNLPIENVELQLAEAPCHHNLLSQTGFDFVYAFSDRMFTQELERLRKRAREKGSEDAIPKVRSSTRHLLVLRFLCQCPEGGRWRRSWPGLCRSTPGLYLWIL